MNRVCAYCQKDMGEKEPINDHSVTHGICDDCLKIENSKSNCEGEGRTHWLACDHREEIFRKLLNATDILLSEIEDNEFTGSLTMVKIIKKIVAEAEKNL